ncbi:MAG: hypothetical protein WD077_09070 [Bacteroidia bacterium]
MSLTAAAEGFTEKAVMIEMDEVVAAVWKTILSAQNENLRKHIIEFDLTTE